MASVGGGNDGGAYQPMFQISDPVRARVLVDWLVVLGSVYCAMNWDDNYIMLYAYIYCV